MNHLRLSSIVALLVLAGALAGCVDKPPQALGTLEYDRITLPAPAAERIVAIEVREGQCVVAGQPLLQLEATRTQSIAEAARANAQRLRAALGELQSGPRGEKIAQARAQLAAVQAQARESRSYYMRLQPLGRQRLVAAADVDRARAAAASADAQVSAATEALAELESGTRQEQIAQARSALQAAEAQASAQLITLGELHVVAPRAGRIDSLPYKVGDQAPVGAPLAILLVGYAPHARIYLPEPLRAKTNVGDAVRVFVDGRDGALHGKVRMIRSEPSFTPYYALTGDDAARLSYQAEVELTDKQARQLPAGLPVRVEFGSDGAVP